ncbi:uncharacterized protein [Miscanthus floridulus]|uniref:uncharacterized protein n=1 Tax=Miscanthus floridulus TaxID=154761 RepID=UPI003459A2BE
MAAGVIIPLERRSTRSILSLSERFYLGGNRSLVCRLGGPSSLSGFEAKGLELKDFRTSAPNNSENGAFASPELHGGGDIAVTAFADLSFDLPLKPLRELGIHGHTFISAGNLAKLTDHGHGKFSLTDFLQTFRSSAGFGVVVPTKLFRIEMNYCYILKQFDHDKGKAGHHLTLGTSLLDVDVNALDWNDGIVFVQGSLLNQPIVDIDKWLLPSYINNVVVAELRSDEHFWDGFCRKSRNG